MHSIAELFSSLDNIVIVDIVVTAICSGIIGVLTVNFCAKYTKFMEVFRLVYSGKAEELASQFAELENCAKALDTHGEKLIGDIADLKTRADNIDATIEKRRAEIADEIDAGVNTDYVSVRFKYSYDIFYARSNTYYDSKNGYTPTEHIKCNMVSARAQEIAAGIKTGGLGGMCLVDSDLVIKNIIVRSKPA